MPVKIRLARRGRRKAPFYHIVVADSRAPRDGRFIEQLGSYNPMTKPATIELDRDRALDWLMKGAQPTYTARAILRFKGVLYKKHLQRGVDKGAITQEQADAKFTEWVNDKDAKIAARFEESQKEMEAFRKMISGEVKKAEKVTADDADREAFRESSEEAPTENVEVAESETPVENTEATAETNTEVVSEEAPAQEASEEVAEEASKEEE